jgi:cell division protein ZapE
VTNVADAVILGRLLAALFERGVVMVATSNTAPDDLYAGGLQRELFLPAVALIKERLDVLELEGGVDYRLQQKLARMALYFTPLGEQARDALEQAFAALTDGAPGGPEEVNVRGRTLVVSRAAKGVAMASFVELCERPLGAADYLAIATHFHTLILDGVPYLDPERRNEARRLITLIDALYEHRVKLICAAARPPEGLHPAGDHAREFRRTASRLHEMQSEAYLMSPHLT